MLSLILLVAGLAILVKCADIFVDGSSNIAKAFGIPSLIIGLTIVAFGTSAPEAAVSITAGIKGSNEISIGNVVGSNICNSLLILGFCGLFKALKAKKEVRKSKLVTLNNINFCCYDCYDEYLRTLSKEDWYKFFGINIGNSN